MKKVAFIVLHLGYGGAERAVISEANLLSEFCEVEIISFYKLYDKPAFPVNPNVRVTYLTDGLKPNRDELAAALRNRQLIRLFREGFKSVKILYLRKSLMKKAVKNCTADVIISSRYIYHRLLSSNAKKGVVCIAQEHNHHNGNKKYIRNMLSAVKHMDYFMPVSRELTDFYAERVGKKVCCKYIPHHLETMPDRVSDLAEKNIISVGRLSYEKGMDELIRVFAEVNKLHGDWKLHLIGDGEERDKIEKLIAALGLENNVILYGFKSQEEIAKLSLSASLYVMTSLTESFGLVLIEAMSFGLPCIAYDSAQGAKEIIKNGVNGVLVEKRSRSAMVAEIDKLICDYGYRREMGIKGRETAERFSKENVIELWKELF